MSSYKFAPGIEVNSFVFPTDMGWSYTVSFLDRSKLVVGYKILENGGSVFEVMIDRSPLSEVTKGEDAAVGKTIQAILAHQLQLQGNRAIYFFWCDMHDRHEAARARLFYKWHRTCPLAGWDLINFELSDLETEELTYFGGLFVHADHPHYPEIEEAFVHLLRHDLSSGKLVSWF